MIHNRFFSHEISESFWWQLAIKQYFFVLDWLGGLSLAVSLLLSPVTVATCKSVSGNTLHHRINKS
jgi:hypothetical protein